MNGSTVTTDEVLAAVKELSQLWPLREFSPADVYHHLIFCRPEETKEKFYDVNFALHTLVDSGSLVYGSNGAILTFALPVTRDFVIESSEEYLRRTNYGAY